jgi:hypothetical protein
MPFVPGANPTVPSACMGTSETRTALASAGGFSRTSSKRTCPETVMPGWRPSVRPEIRSPSTAISVDAQTGAGGRAVI